MSGTPIPVKKLPGDQPARDRILADLDTNLLVEAGAGSGKTTSLVGRMLALVARGTPVERIAAVTFTRKAANELRERFQLRLEAQLRDTWLRDDERARFDVALHDLDRAYLGTIHSFCGRLLRERPLEVGIDPNFQEVTDDDWVELQQEFWSRWLERMKREDDPSLMELARVGIEPRSLYRGFERVVDFPDVDFPLADSAAPSVGDCRRKLEALMKRAADMLPASEPPTGWDKLQKVVRRLTVQRRIAEWSDVATFCAAIESIARSACDVTQNRWGADKETKKAAKELGADFAEFVEGPAAEVLRCWREHRYPIVMRFLTRAARDFERERHATAQLGFGDLLLLAAKLLRENAGARDELGERYRHLLVDEFQDTDPVQAEVCLLLASPSAQGNDWRSVVPRAGGIFVVGDPKQSVYRFRRADVQVYELVKKRFRAFGDVLSLTQNFRSTEPIEQLVNGQFAEVFPAEGTAAQAPFSPMRTDRPGEPLDGVFYYNVCPEGRRQELLYDEDAATLASWIAARLAAGERTPGDFLILTETRKPIEYYARALAERNVPVSTTGAALPQELELQELLVVMRTMADPDNSVLVAAALEGLFFGLTPADLYDARRAGLHFSVTHPPTESESPSGAALKQLHEWWMLSQRHPADVLLERIIDDTGLLFHAASQPLGDARGGALLHLVEALRSVSMTGASGVSDALRRLELLLAREAPDAPLRPGRTDAVRVMNLHKAKGLEATVVILAAPHEREPFAPEFHVRRTEKGATGGLVIRDGDNVIAHPPGWAELEADEAEFAAAERARLLYVASTRPMRELVVARCEKNTQARGTEHLGWAWTPLEAMLNAVAKELDITVMDAPGRRAVEHTAEEMRAAVAEADARRVKAALPSLRVHTVTESAKEERQERRAYDLPSKGGLGAAWGRAVHRALEGAGRGRKEESLRFFIRAVAVYEGLDDERTVALEKLVAQVQASDAWKRLMSGGGATFELPVTHVVREGKTQLVTEGVIDALGRDGDNWLVLDWKTDDVLDAKWSERAGGYEKQVRGYAEILTALTGQAATWEIVRARLD